MRRVARWAFRLVIGVAIAGVSALGTAVWVALHQYDRPAIPLTAGLSGDWAAVTQKFDQRVKTRFPLNSSASSMGADLRNQGFSREDWECSAAQEHEAVRREDNFACRAAARIYWNADSDGRLTSIKGVYREEGCL